MAAAMYNKAVGVFFDKFAYPNKLNDVTKELEDDSIIQKQFDKIMRKYEKKINKIVSN